MAEFRPVYGGSTGKIEGEYADLLGDSGGRTWKGISENNNPDWPGWKIIDIFIGDNPKIVHPDNRRLLNRELRAIRELEQETFARMKMKYWDVFWGDRIKSQAVAEEMYDQTVHFGAHTSIKHLQRVLNVLNRRGKTCADIVVDGAYGPGTHAALTKVAASAARHVELYLNCLQGARYVMLAESSSNSKFEAWLHGFALRLEV